MALQIKKIAPEPTDPVKNGDPIEITERSERLARSIIDSDIQNNSDNSFVSANIMRARSIPGLPPVGFHPTKISKYDGPDNRLTKDKDGYVIDDVTMLRCLDMRSRGKNMHEIASKLDTTVAMVSKMLDLALRAVAAGSTDRAEQVRDLENYRLDRMLDRLWPMVDPEDKDLEPDLQAVDRVLRIMERRAKMYGIDNLTESESSDGITRTINFTQIIANNPDSIDLSHRLLELANNTITASITSGPGVPAHTGQVQDTATHLTSLFDLDEGDGGDLPAGSGGDAAETRQDRTDQ